MIFHGTVTHRARLMDVGNTDGSDRHTVKTPAAIKTTGYLVSTVSVLLLGVVSWKSAQTDPLLATCLVAGMLASIAGMMLRWISYRMDEK